MIVFTATNLRTHDVYVGTARESVEEEWAELLAQAENGTSGQFFEQLREQGAAGFEVDTWAYGETPAEARESMREARDELGAQPIKSSRGSKPTLRQPKTAPSASMKALMAVFEEAMSEEGESLDDDEALEGIGSSNRQSRSSEAETPAATAAVVERSVKVEHSSRVESVSARPEPVKPVAESGALAEDTPSAEEARLQARLEAMKAEEARMLARLEAMKAEQARLLAGRDNAPVAADVSAAQQPQSEPQAEHQAQPQAEAQSEQQAPRSQDEAGVQSTAADEARRQARLEAMKAAQAKLLREREAQPPQTPTFARPATPAPAAKIASGRTSSSAKERRIRDAIEAERERRESLRQSQARDEHAEMTAVMARVEMRRLATKRANAEKAKKQAAQVRSARRAEERAKTAPAPAAKPASARPSSASVSPPVASAPSQPTEPTNPTRPTLACDSEMPIDSVQAALKLAAGRTGSSSKEKRIKEAIEQEKAERMAKQQAQRAREADEMAAILARLDERAKAAEKFKRRR